jgi:hypothetical protein
MGVGSVINYWWGRAGLFEYLQICSTFIPIHIFACIGSEMAVLMRWRWAGFDVRRASPTEKVDFSFELPEVAHSSTTNTSPIA